MTDVCVIYERKGVTIVNLESKFSAARLNITVRTLFDGHFHSETHVHIIREPRPSKQLGVGFLHSEIIYNTDLEFTDFLREKITWL